jgi:lambda repressor-like predicted transcriptional regulator
MVMATLATNYQTALSNCAGMERRLVELFADMFPAYQNGSAEIKEIIRSMVGVIKNPATSEEERRAATDTLVEVLFPQPELLGVDLENIAEIGLADAAETEAAMIAEEAAFAKTLRGLMRKHGVTQKKLAETIGVGQPAISMLLSRKCRPQRTTVKKIADALGVEPKVLWPKF